MSDVPQKLNWSGILLLIVALAAFPAGWAAHAYLPRPTPTPAPTPPAPTPPAPPAPESLLKLTGSELYVIDSPYDCFLLASPAELVSITPEKGPITIRAKFGPGKIETKVFKGPYVFTVEAAGKGKVELLLVKAGAQGPADVIHKLVDVDSGEGPRPPPPPQPPEPTPQPTDPLFTPAQAAYTADPSPTKNFDAHALASVYRSVAAGLGGIKTPKELFTVFSNVRQAKIANRLLSVRDVANAELDKLFGGKVKENYPLTDDDRKKIADLFTRFAAVLERLR